MSRTPLTIDVPTPSFQPPESFTVNLQTITPMFGGSALTREVDRDHPVRAASVRGHLRFWWRATVGAQFKTAEGLFQAEAEIWGRTPQLGKDQKVDPHAFGKVRLEVKTLAQGVVVHPTDLGVILRRSAAQVGPLEGFFVYPFRADNKQEEASGRRDVKFRLKVILDPKLSTEQQEEVKMALRAWIAFGGVGARTRRGCGALGATGENAQEWTPKNTAQLWEWFAEEGDLKAKHSVLQGSRVHFSECENDVETKVWRDLGRFWARFRKGHYTERHPTYSPMSGSSWQDHGTLKRLSRGEAVSLVKPFLGLPIVYQRFPRTDAFVGTVDAVAKFGTRMASPIILKPVQFHDGVRGMVMVLNTPMPKEVSISGQKHDLSVPAYDRVLMALNVRSPHMAVSAAAKQDGYTEEVRL